MSKQDKELTEEEYLQKHLEDIDSNKNVNTSETFNYEKNSEGSKAIDLQYLTFDVKELPCGKFYPSGSVLMVRPAQVREIQAYSMVDDNNFYDIIEKMNDMLQSCVRIKSPDGKVTSFLEVKDQDRLPLIFLIRELTFQQGNSLAVNKECVCGCELQIELNRHNFEYHEIDDSLLKYFDNSSKCFRFRTRNGKEFEITPPTIGLQKSFTEYIIKENNEKKTQNLSFLKIIPFMLVGRTNITIEGIKSKLTEFEKMDDMSFQFLNSAVSKMTFGIKELKTTCSQCGTEVRTDMNFPNGASGIFVIHDAFEAYIEK